MAFGDRGHSQRFSKERSRIFTEYEAKQHEISLKEEERLKKEAIKAQKQTVKLKGAETVHDLLQKGYANKTKQIMAQDFFKDTKFGAGDKAINMYSASSEGPNVPFSDMFGYKTPGVNPSVYEQLGQSAYKGTDAANMTPELYQELGREVVAGGGAPEVAEAGAKITEEMGSFTKLSEWLGPIGAGIGMFSGLSTMTSGQAEEDEQVAATAQSVGYGMVAGGAAFTALTGTAVANAWNPIGWTLGIGGSLYGAGKGMGIF